MKIIYSGFDTGDHIARSVNYWSAIHPDKLKIEELKKQLIKIPTSKEEAEHNQEIQKKIKEIAR